MTRHRSSSQRMTRSSHAALHLHRRPPNMRVLAFSLLLLAALPAAAQTTPAPTYPCMGKEMVGQMGIAYKPKGSQNLISVQPSSVATAFGNAECFCDTNDLVLQFYLTAS